MPKKLYLLKIGGSIITDTTKPSAAKRAEIRRIVREIKAAKDEGDFNLIIGHGSGSFAHRPAKKYRTNEGIVNKDSRKGATITHMVAKELNDIFVEEALKSGLDVFPFSPSSFGVHNGEHWASGTTEPIKEAMNRSMIPVTYGDVVMNSKNGFSIASTERVFEFIASRLKPDKVILATDVDGVFDKDPRKCKDAKLVRNIDRNNITAALKWAKGSHKVDVTGGMHSKLSFLYGIAKMSGGEGVILNGKKDGRIRDALLGRYGTATVVRP
jgi:isopentenyl phosphate kinase